MEGGTLPLSVSFWTTLIVSTRRVVTVRTSAATTTSSPPATTHRRPGYSQQDCYILRAGRRCIPARNTYLGLRRLKHESNKKFLGMSSKVPPFALYPDKLTPSSRDAKPEPQSKKTGWLRIRKRCTIFRKDTTMAKKRTENNRAKVRFCSILV